MANPPLWIYRQTILPYGSRLQKLKKWEEPKRNDLPARYSTITIPTKDATWRGSDGKLYKYDYDLKRTVEIKEPPVMLGRTQNPGNLENSEYFKWIGRRHPGIKAATCRACGFIAVDQEARRKHGGCGKLCQNAWILMRADKTEENMFKCAVCNTGTTYIPWGVPLCKGCIETWKFGLPVTCEVPGVMSMAIDLAKMNMGITS